jgi:hypothetical protein
MLGYTYDSVGHLRIELEWIATNSNYQLQGSFECEECIDRSVANRGLLLGDKAAGAWS